MIQVIFAWCYYFQSLHLVNTLPTWIPKDVGQHEHIVLWAKYTAGYTAAVCGPITCTSGKKQGLYWGDVESEEDETGSHIYHCEIISCYYENLA